MKTQLNFQDADAFYEQLLDAHQGLSAQESALFDARLILLLANQVGDGRVLQECVEAARAFPTAPAPPSGATPASA
jgi:hypothetical protein